VSEGENDRSFGVLQKLTTLPRFTAASALQDRLGRGELTEIMCEQATRVPQVEYELRNCRF